MSNPFLSSQSKPGYGIIDLALLPPATPRLQTVSYQYPLKLVAPAPVHNESGPPHLIHTVYLLTYGGGLVAGDCIELNVTLAARTRLVLLTQGSTKLFKAPSPDVLSKQCITVTIAPQSALCYLPDPVQPFERSGFEQRQVYNIVLPREDSATTGVGSLCALDWVCNGRPANGENWSFYHYASRNDVLLQDVDDKTRLLLRDNVVLDANSNDGTLAARMDAQAVLGTLILYGPLFAKLGQFFMNEFKQLPRIGGRKWDSSSDSGEDEVDAVTVWRIGRQRQDTADGLLWSAALLRGSVIIKFGAREVEGGKRWLRSMLMQEGSVMKEFGERSMLCLR